MKADQVSGLEIDFFSQSIIIISSYGPLSNTFQFYPQSGFYIFTHAPPFLLSFGLQKMVSLGVPKRTKIIWCSCQSQPNVVLSFHLPRGVDLVILRNNYTISLCITSQMSTWSSWTETGLVLMMLTKDLILLFIQPKLKFSSGWRNKLTGSLLLHISWLHSGKTTPCIRLISMPVPLPLLIQFRGLSIGKWDSSIPWTLQGCNDNLLIVSCKTFYFLYHLCMAFFGLDWMICKQSESLAIDKVSNRIIYIATNNYCRSKFHARKREIGGYRQNFTRFFIFSDFVYH